jgi:hypothetical protein
VTDAPTWLVSYTGRMAIMAKNTRAKHGPFYGDNHERGRDRQQLDRVRVRH